MVVSLNENFLSFLPRVRSTRDLSEMIITPFWLIITKVG